MKTTQTTRALTSVATVAALLCSTANAAEPLARYDSFKTPGIDLSRWLETDNARTATGGVLHLSRTTRGGVNGDTGTVYEVQPLSFANPSAISAIAADVTVETVTSMACPNNTAVGSSKLRIGGGFFNLATPTPGSALNDVVAQITVGRASNSADDEGVLRISGLVVACLSADCSAQRNMGTPVDLGNLATGSATRLTLQLDRSIKSFRFQRDDGTTQLISYTENDSAEAGAPAKSFSVRNLAPNCATGPRTTAQMLGRIDRVFVNKAAAQP